MIFYQNKKWSNSKSGFNHTHNYAPNLHLSQNMRSIICWITHYLNQYVSKGFTISFNDQYNIFRLYHLIQHKTIKTSNTPLSPNTHTHTQKKKKRPLIHQVVIVSLRLCLEIHKGMKWNDYKRIEMNGIK